MAEATVITDLFGHVEKTGKRKSKDERDRLRKSLLNHKFSLDCFRVPQPAFMSFSGGRTSALMLYYTLQAYDWKLPPDYRIVFMNTGMERWETLDFVHECEQRWNVDIHWLEWRDPDKYGVTFEKVSYTTASRHGEPFEALINKQGYCPNRVARTCTGRLKIRVLRDFIRTHKWWEKGVLVHNTVGLRADEELRVANATADDGYNASEGLLGICPLADAGITKPDVDRFWAKMGATEGFDLAIPSEAGNCTLCFLKGQRKLVALIRQHPGLADWWIRQEEALNGKTEKVSGARFSRQFSYRSLLEHVQKQPELADLSIPNTDMRPCSCTD